MTINQIKERDNLVSEIRPLKEFDNGRVWLKLDVVRNLLIFDLNYEEYGRIIWKMARDPVYLTHVLKNGFNLSDEIVKEVTDYIGLSDIV